MPADTILQRRDRAVIAFTMITGVRVGALISLRMKHVDLDAGTVTQDAREVRTKNSKSFTTGFFPVSVELKEIVSRWIAELRENLCWGQDDPLFPATEILRGNDGLFRPIGLKREAWATAEPVRKLFRDAFAAVGLPYFNPHSLRKTLALIGERRCNTAEKMKAWSQNLGHDRVQTTLSSYGTLSVPRQIELVSAMSRDPGANASLESLAMQLVEAAKAQTGPAG
jgi:integrase